MRQRTRAGDLLLRCVPHDDDRMRSSQSAPGDAHPYGAASGTEMPRPAAPRPASPPRSLRMFRRCPRHSAPTNIASPSVSMNSLLPSTVGRSARRCPTRARAAGPRQGSPRTGHLALGAADRCRRYAPSHRRRTAARLPTSDRRSGWPGSRTPALRASAPRSQHAPGRCDGRDVRVVAELVSPSVSER
jgi:hypothetical protein